MAKLVCLKHVQVYIAINYCACPPLTSPHVCKFDWCLVMSIAMEIRIFSPKRVKNSIFVRKTTLKIIVKKVKVKWVSWPIYLRRF